ncbi:MAG TPA: hypothetical protein DCR98_02715 [Cobetia sp.]|nr:hypothetical protein [Cobetia sp.]HBJ29042.1 hypothetical protein [Cobetia sp.]
MRGTRCAGQEGGRVGRRQGRKGGRGKGKGEKKKGRKRREHRERAASVARKAGIAWRSVGDKRQGLPCLSSLGRPRHLLAHAFLGFHAAS